MDEGARRAWPLLIALGAFIGATVIGRFAILFGWIA
jgi:hypothetical protein